MGVVKVFVEQVSSQGLGEEEGGDKGFAFKGGQGTKVDDSDIVESRGNEGAAEGIGR